MGKHIDRRAMRPGRDIRAFSGARLVVAALLCCLAASLGPVNLALADTVRDATARWADGTGASVVVGEVINSEWRFNLNSDLPAPTNDPVDNVHAVITATNGVFTQLPDACLTVGVDPVSTLSADAKTMTCNFGTQVEGTALAVQVPVVADGTVGEDVSLSGAFGEATAFTTPLPITQSFSIDFKLSETDAWYATASSSSQIEFPWSLSKGLNSVDGPNTVSFTITPTLINAALRVDSTHPVTCDPFTTDLPKGASGHPWSGGNHPADQQAAFPTSCTVKYNADQTFTLTLNGMDWNPDVPPTKDSAGHALRTDQEVVASGVVRFYLQPSSSVYFSTVQLDASAPTYTSRDGSMTTVDDSSNNTAKKVIPLGAAWSGIWGRGDTGTTSWDDQLRKSAGAALATYQSATLPAGAGSRAIAQCAIVDSKYVSVSGAAIVSPVPSTLGSSVLGPYTVWYYTATTPETLNPASPAYDPNSVWSDSSTCGSLPESGWTTTLPSDLGTIKAVRVGYESADMAGRMERVALKVPVQIHPDVPEGQDVWVWFSYGEDGKWSNSTTQITATNKARYPFTTSARDVLRIVAAMPAIAKSVDHPTIHFGDSPTFTLNYSANGGSYIAATVDGYVVTDMLPVGLTYLAGSSSPVGEPTVTITSGGQQVLTWNLDGVKTNTSNTLTYQTTTNTRTVAGQVMTNSATSSISTFLDPKTKAPWKTAPASASVTVSSDGTTVIGKSADQSLIPNIEGNGIGTGSWTVTLRADDPSGQTFTDIVDILPFNGDERGTSFAGTYAVTEVEAGDATVYYTTASPETLSDDPADSSNGAAGDPIGNTSGWTTTKPTDAATITAIRVIGGPLAPTEIRSFQVFITTSGAKGGDTFVNKAWGRASHTELVMRTSDPTTVSRHYAYDLKKYVQDAEGAWHDAQDTNSADWPSFPVGTSTVNYRIVVTNTGQGDLTDITVTDGLFPQGDHTIASLPSGQENVFEFTADLSSYAAGEQVRNLASAHTELPLGTTTQETLPDPSDEANVTFSEANPIHVIKQGANCDVDAETCSLGGAQFALYDVDPSTPGATPIAGGIDADTEGGAEFTSRVLAPGTYWLVETRAPEGFTLMPTPVEFTFSTTGISLSPTGSTGVSLKDGDALTIVVTDSTSAPLPEAGGTGPLPFTLAALSLFGLGALSTIKTSARHRVPGQVRH